MDLKKKWLTQYIDDQAKVLKSIPTKTLVRITELLEKAADEGRTIFVFGNGGSAGNTSHFATDMSKTVSDTTGKKFRVISLNDNVGLVTAIGNDYAYRDIFLQQLKNLAISGDIIFTMSVSGKSPNIVSAVKWAKKNRLTVITFVGKKGNALAKIANIAVKINSTHYGQVEDCQMIAAHMICYTLMENLQTSRRKFKRA